VPVIEIGQRVGIRIRGRRLIRRHRVFRHAGGCARGDTGASFTGHGDWHVEKDGLRNRRSRRSTTWRRRHRDRGGDRERAVVVVRRRHRQRRELRCRRIVDHPMGRIALSTWPTLKVVPAGIPLRTTCVTCSEPSTSVSVILIAPSRRCLRRQNAVRIVMTRRVDLRIRARFGLKLQVVTSSPDDRRAIPLPALVPGVEAGGALAIKNSPPTLAPTHCSAAIDVFRRRVRANDDHVTRNPHRSTRWCWDELAVGVVVFTTNVERPHCCSRRTSDRECRHPSWSIRTR